MSEKPQLPFGWVVKHSKSYPDRVYYFNVNSGASTWEFPDLIKDYNVSKDFKINKREGGGVVIEHQTPNQEVLGSIPTGSTMLCP